MCSSGRDNIFIIALYQVRATVQRVAKSTTFCTWCPVVKVLVAVSTLMRHKVKAKVWLSVSSYCQQEFCPNPRARRNSADSAVYLQAHKNSQVCMGPSQKIHRNWGVATTLSKWRCFFSDLLESRNVKSSSQAPYYSTTINLWTRTSNTCTHIGY